MLVNRRTFVVKKPHLDEALALLAEYRDLAKLLDSSAMMRVYASEIGPFDTIACELETAGLGAFERTMRECPSSDRVLSTRTWIVHVVPRV